MNSNKERLATSLVLIVVLFGMFCYMAMLVIDSNVDHANVQAAQQVEVTRVVYVPDYVVRVVHHPVVVIRDMCIVSSSNTITSTFVLPTQIVVDNDNSNIIVATSTPQVSTITRVAPTATTIPSTSTPVPTTAPTAMPEPTSVPTAEPTKCKGCNEGLGNGPDGDNNGHEGDTDDNDNQGPQPNECGTPGHPCKKENGKNSILPILPLFSVLLIGNPLLDHLLRAVTEIHKTPISVRIDYSVIHAQIHDIMTKSHQVPYTTPCIKDKDGDYPGDMCAFSSDAQRVGRAWRIDK